jgi:hypothetical protein
MRAFDPHPGDDAGYKGKPGQERLMDNDATEIIRIALQHPAGLASFVGSVVTSFIAVAGMGWYTANYLNRREINDYKRQKDEYKNHLDRQEAIHQREMLALAKQPEGRLVIDELFPGLGDLEPIGIGYLGARAAQYPNSILPRRPAFPPTCGLDPRRCPWPACSRNISAAA